MFKISVIWSLREAYLNYFAIDKTRGFAIKVIHKVQITLVQFIEYGIYSLMQRVRISKGVRVADAHNQCDGSGSKAANVTSGV